MPRCQNIECGQDREEARKPEVGMISTFIDARWQGRRTSAMAIHSSVVQYYQYLSNIRQAIYQGWLRSPPDQRPRRPYLAKQSEPDVATRWYLSWC